MGGRRNAGGLRMEVWHVEILGGLDFLPQLGKRHDKSGEEEEGPKRGLQQGVGKREGGYGQGM